MTNVADRVFLLSIGMVLAGSLFIENANITNLSLIVILSAHTILTTFLTENFLHNNMWLVSLLSSAINGLCFSLVAFPFWMAFRKEKVVLCSIFLMSFLFLYGSFMFLFLPATDGP